MRAEAGDRIVIRAHHMGEPDRYAEILEVHGANGAPPYVLRWDENGHEVLYFPGPDAMVDHLHGRPRGESG